MGTAGWQLNTNILKDIICGQILTEPKGQNFGFRILDFGLIDISETKFVRFFIKVFLAQHNPDSGIVCMIGEDR